MQNIDTLHAVQLPLRFPVAPQLPVISNISYAPTLCTVSRTSLTTLSVSYTNVYPTNIPPASVAINTLLPTSPSGLAYFADCTLLALRTGQVYNVDFETRSAAIVADVTHVVPARSGVLALSISPDSNIMAIVSPHSLSLLDTKFSTIGQFVHPKLASHASITWRSDGEFLAYTIRTSTSLLGFVVNRTCTTATILDIDPDLSENLALVMAWEPRIGGRIAIAGPSSAVTFFERNGQRLRRNDFKIVANGTPNLLSWSPDARLLAIASEEREDQSQGDCFRVAFFHHFNYKWYCKKRYAFQHRVIGIFWDPDEIGSVLIITDHDVFSFTLFLAPPVASISSSWAIATVVDGPRVELTDFLQARLPPPISHASICCEEDVVSVSSLRNGDGLCILMADGVLDWCLFNQSTWRTERPGVLSTASMYARRERRSLIPSDDQSTILPSELKFSIMPSQSCVVVVALSKPWDQRSNEKPSDILLLFPLPSARVDDWDDVTRCHIYGQVTAVAHAFEEMAIIIAIDDGSLRRIAIDEPSGGLMEVACVMGLSKKIIRIEEVPLRCSRVFCIFLDMDGRLDLVEMDTSRKLLLSNECTSFCVHEGFLVFTTKSHFLHCVALDSVTSLANEENRETVPSILDTFNAAYQLTHLPEGGRAARPIDEGAIIVTPLPGKTDIVLLVPRGNIETISPRPIVFEVVDRLAKEKKYGPAFELCRKQRVDMNHIVDADFDCFLENVAQFVAQVGDSANLSVFLTLLKGETTRVNRVCDAVINQIAQLPDAIKFRPATMTGLIRKDPPDVIGALEEVRQARVHGTDAAQTAIDFLFLLVKDEKKVYSEALGLYDLDLAAFVAESSRMDPAEYSKELHLLRSTEENDRKHKIDMKLQRYDSAFQHLYICGEHKYEDCIKLCHDHALYELALPLLSSDPKRRANLLEGYGNHLRNSRKYDAAAAVFLQNGYLRQAFECYKLGSRWELALNIVGRRGDISDEEKRGAYTEIADELAEKGQMIERARVLVTKLGDLDGAVAAAANVNEWDVAFEAISTYAAQNENEFNSRMSKGWKLVTESVLESTEDLIATIQENWFKMRERGDRLLTLRETAQKLREDMTSSGQGDADSDAFTATGASSIGSNLSDVTFTSKASKTSLFATSSRSQLNGPLSSERLEKQALKRKQRASKKRIREGHPKEAEYLAGYLAKLVPSEFLKERVDKTARALIAIGKPEVAGSLLDHMAKLINEAVMLPDDVVSVVLKVQLMFNPNWDEIRSTLNAITTNVASENC